MTAAISGGYQLATDLSDDDSRCAYAHDAVQDDVLNPNLPQALREDYAKRQYEKTKECDRSDQ